MGRGDVATGADVTRVVDWMPKAGSNWEEEEDLAAMDPDEEIDGERVMGRASRERSEEDCLAETYVVSEEVF